MEHFCWITKTAQPKSGVTTNPVPSQLTWRLHTLPKLWKLHLVCSVWVGNQSGPKTMSSSVSESVSWAQSLEFMTLTGPYSCENLSDAFLWMNPKLQLSFSSFDPCNEYHLDFFFFFLSLKSNDPWSQGCWFKHTGNISLFITDVRFVPQKGRCCQLLGTGLVLVPCLAKQFQQTSRHAPFCVAIAQQNFNFFRWETGCHSIWVKDLAQNGLSLVSFPVLLEYW